MSDKKIYYTICPVANASYIAANHGFLKEKLEKIGYDPIKLQTLEQKEWAAHFTFHNDRLFREGGNIPPLWTKSNGTGVVLLAVNTIDAYQPVLVREDSGINSVADLKGKKLAIPVHTDVLIDFHKASVEHGFELALELNGIAKDEVEWVNVINDEGYHSDRGLPATKSIASAEISALARGEVDAIFTRGGDIGKVEPGLKVKVIYDVWKQSGDVQPVNNVYPNVLTVSEKLAKEEPEVVVAFLKAAIIAARWAKDHKDEAEALLAEQTHSTIEEYRATHTEDHYTKLEPNLDPEALKALQIQSDFLLDHGYLAKPVNVSEWADPSFLSRALTELDTESKKAG